MRYLGLDLGSRTLGMAVSDALGMIASSYKIVRHNEEYDRLLDEVQATVEEKKIEAIVLGLPKNMNNTIGPKGELSFQFKEKLENKLGIPVFLEDERLTTKQAENLLINNDTSRKKRKKVIDSMAATIILQSYLDKNK
ncbi:MAG: Holliday junction resolvase RuvX [Firmicutes bacterium]|nr:Holliday junction resolvase RuvX [Bacillota bacterium]